jgi:hypothetical protein
MFGDVVRVEAGRFKLLDDLEAARVEIGDRMVSAVEMIEDPELEVGQRTPRQRAALGRKLEF